MAYITISKNNELIQRIFRILTEMNSEVGFSFLCRMAVLGKMPKLYCNFFFDNLVIV